MPAARHILEFLTRDELLALVDRSELHVADRRLKAPLLQAANRLTSGHLSSYLADLPRDRLKDLCRNFGLDDGGREKAPLVARLLPRQTAFADLATARGAGERSPVPAVPRSPSKSARPALKRQRAVPQQAVLPLTSSTTTTLSELESHLWGAANILRGSPVDRTDWKSYILPLLFFKRICDVWDEEHAAMLAHYGDDFADEHLFQIPSGCHWNDVRAAARNVGTSIQNAMRGLEAANQKHLYGVFGDGQWTNKERLPDELLKDLVEHFSSLSIGNERVASDVIGDAYEYLIKQFADATNKKAGEFYTPRSVVRLMVDILDPQEGETVYDPACGTGGMLLAAVAHVRDAGGDPRTFFGRLYAQEKNLTTAAVARMNLFLHGLEDFQVERGDTLRNPVFTNPATGGLATFDVVIANPPFSLEQWGREVWESDPWGRAFAGIPTDSSGDFAWVQHMVRSMTEKTGRMGVVLPQGALFRGGIEGEIRKKLLEMDLIEAVIGLAPNLFYGTGLAACILVLRKKKLAARKGKVLICDASTLFRKGRAQNFLEKEHVEQILQWYQDFAEVPDRTRVLTLAAIGKENWTLNISRYVLPPIGADIPPLIEAVAAFKAALARCREAEDNLRKVMDDGGWLKEL